MASVRSQIRGLVLSASELKELTGWPDAMVEDYLNILRNLITLAESVDNNDTDNVDISNSLIYGPVLDVDRHDTVVITDDYTVPGAQTVLCANTLPIVVTLNDTPDDKEKASVKRTNGPVRIESSKTVDGQTTLILKTRYTGLDMLYTVETDSWHIV